MSKPPSRTAIRRALKQLNQSAPPFPHMEQLASGPTVKGVSDINAMRGLKSGQYVLVNRTLLKLLIKELAGK